jgi:GntR family transcriptional regulator
MFDFYLDTHSSVPVYAQLIQQVKQALRLGELHQGDQLPTVKEIVEKLLISPNTVLKAYRELEKEDLIRSRAGVGTFVLKNLSEPLLTNQLPLRRRLVRWMKDAQKEGLDIEDIEALVSSVRQECYFQENKEMIS